MYLFDVPSLNSSVVRINMSSICCCILSRTPDKLFNSVVVIVLVLTFPVILETITLLPNKSFCVIVEAAPVIASCFVLIYSTS